MTDSPNPVAERLKDDAAFGKGAIQAALAALRTGDTLAAEAMLQAGLDLIERGAEACAIERGDEPEAPALSHPPITAGASKGAIRAAVNKALPAGDVTICEEDIDAVTDALLSLTAAPGWREGHALAQAVQRFRHAPSLKRATALRASQQFSDMVDAWDAYVEAHPYARLDAPAPKESDRG